MDSYDHFGSFNDRDELFNQSLHEIVIMLLEKHYFYLENDIIKIIYVSF